MYLHFSQAGNCYCTDFDDSASSIGRRVFDRSTHFPFILFALLWTDFVSFERFLMQSLDSVLRAVRSLCRPSPCPSNLLASALSNSEQPIHLAYPSSLVSHIGPRDRYDHIDLPLTCLDPWLPLNLTLWFVDPFNLISGTFPSHCGRVV